MKRTSLLLAVLLLLGFAAQSFAAGTPAGTVISNQATGNYQDGNGNAMPSVSSNIVQTTVDEAPGVTITSPADQNVANGSSVVYAHVITNTGNFTDEFAISMTNTDNTKFTAVLYHDLGTVGVYDAGTDTVITGNYSIAADAGMNVLTRVTNVSASQGDATSSTVTATSQHDGTTSTSDQVVTTATEAAISGTLTANQASYNPGETITYTVDFTNNGNETAYSTVVTLHIPTNTTYVPNSTELNSAPLVDGTVWSSGTGTVNVGDVAAGGNPVITFQVTVNNDATGTISDAAEINYDNSQGADYAQVDLSENVSVTRTYGVTVASPDPGKTGESGSTVKYLLTVTNTGNGTDNYNWSKDVGLGWTWTFYLDDEGDGDETNDSPLSDTDSDGAVDTDDILPSGSVQIIAIAQIPGGTADGTQDVTTVTFTSDDGSTSDDQALTTDVEAPFLTLVKSVNPSGDQPPGTELTYTVVVTNSGSTDAISVVITDPVPTNTTYVNGSLTIDSESKTDAQPDADGAHCDGSTATFNLGTVTTTTPKTVTFKVTIN